MTEYRWLTRARGVAAGVLALLGVAAGASEVVPSSAPLVGVAVWIALYNFVLGQVARRVPDGSSPAAGVALFLDAVSLTVYLHFSGDIENPMRSLYALPVIAAALLRTRGYAFGLAGTCLGLFAALVFMTSVDGSPIRLSHHHLALLEGVRIQKLADPDDNPERVEYLFVHVGYLGVLLLASAFGFGTLAQRLRAKEREVKRENDRMAFLLGTLPEGVALLARDGTVLLSNKVVETLLEGRTLKEAESELGILGRMAGLSGRTEEFEISYRGRFLSTVLAQASPEDPVVWVFRDQTEQRRMMGRMMHQSKMADLGLLAAGIAHEIGNPLSSMSAILQLLQMKQAAPEIADRLKSLATHVDRIGMIVREITQFARPSAGNTAHLPLAEVVEKALQTFRFHRKSKGLEVSVLKPDRPVMVEGVEDQLIQVVLNLLLNAADASKEGGKLEVAVAERGNEAAISVRDEGAGMSEEVRNQIFAPFFTTKEPGKGVGLGLFVCDAIIRSHHGRFEVESTPGKGTVITVRLPRGEGN